MGGENRYAASSKTSRFRAGYLNIQDEKVGYHVYAALMHRGCSTSKLKAETKTETAGDFSESRGRCEPDK